MFFEFFNFFFVNSNEPLAEASHCGLSVNQFTACKISYFSGILPPGEITANCNFIMLTAYAARTSGAFFVFSRSPFVYNSRCHLYSASTTTDKSRSYRAWWSNEIRRVNEDLRESHITVAQLPDFGQVKDIIKPSDLPKVQRALSELTPSNYIEQLENLGVEPPEPGWNLNQLLTNGAYLDKEKYYRKIVYRSDQKNSFRKSFVSYPRRWGKTVMIQAAAKILRWSSVKALEGPLSKAKQPVLVLNFGGWSIDFIPTYICKEINKLADAEGLQDESTGADTLRSFVGNNNAVGAVWALSDALETKDKKRPLHILIDEYDFPVVDAINPLDNDQYAKCMKFYQRFFAATKSLRGAIVVTGVSRIGMAGIFSGANHLVDVTFQHQFNGLLGLSWEEILDNYGKALPLIAKRNKLNSIEELKQKMILWYDGYRFDVSEAGNDSDTLFNPFSIHALVREGNFEPYWANSGHSSWILTQDICKYLLRSDASSFKLGLNELTSMRIDYKGLGTHSGSLPEVGTDLADVNKLRLLVALHAGYLTIKRVDNSTRSADAHVPNEEVMRDALDYLNKGSGVTRWRRDLDEGFVQDDVRVMMKAMCGEDGFLNYWREGAVIDSFYRKETVKDISEAWLERMLSFMLYLGNIRTTITQFKVPKEETSEGVPRMDVIFNGTKFAHVIELKHKRTSLDMVKKQLQGYAGRKRLKKVLNEWNKNALYWVIFFDESNLGKDEDIADVTSLEIWVEGPYETDESGLLQIRANE